MSETLTAELVLAEPVDEQLVSSDKLEPVAPTTLTIPSRWGSRGSKMTHAEAVAEVEMHAKLLAAGSKALCGLYLRICDTMRTHSFSNEEMKKVLSKHFARQRVDELIQVVNAPDDVYRKYHAQLIGFRAVLEQCRSYRIHSCDFLKKKTILRTAHKLIKLLERKTCAFTIGGFKITLQPADTKEIGYAPVGLPDPNAAADVAARQDELQKIVQMRHLGERKAIRDQIWTMRAALKIGPQAMSTKLEIPVSDYNALESGRRELSDEVWATVEKNFTLLKANMAARAGSN
jgi:hypothetical protein